MTIKTLAIIGSGTMGGGIAMGAVMAGIRTLLIDTNDAALDSARARTRKFLDRRRDKGALSAEQAEAAFARLETSQDMAAVGDADLVIEAIFEDLTVKRALFDRIMPLVRDDALIATNTSCLRVTDLAQSVTRPDRFLGLHYFSPAEINPLVEVVRGPQTAQAAIDTVLPFLEDTGKTPLLCRDSNGFAVNRFFCPYSNEAARCLDDGLGSPAQIDAVARETFDLALGPFAVMNIIKPRINLHAIRNLESLGAFYVPAVSMTEQGTLDQNWQIDETPEALSDDAAARIRDRLMGALFLPVLQAIEEDVAEPDDFDLGARLALRFGRPPVALMRAVGDDAVRRVVSPLLERHGIPAFPKGIERLGPVPA